MADFSGSATGKSRVERNGTGGLGGFQVIELCIWVVDIFFGDQQPMGRPGLSNEASSGRSPKYTSISFASEVVLNLNPPEIGTVDLPVDWRPEIIRAWPAQKHLYRYRAP